LVTATEEGEEGVGAVTSQSFSAFSARKLTPVALMTRTGKHVFEKGLAQSPAILHKAWTQSNHR
jgi:hypothetical protein